MVTALLSPAPIAIKQDGPHGVGEKRDFQEKLKGHGLLGEIQPLCVACSDDGPASRKTRSFMAIGQVPASRCFFLCVCVCAAVRAQGRGVSFQ